MDPGKDQWILSRFLENSKKRIVEIKVQFEYVRIRDLPIAAFNPSMHGCSNNGVPADDQCPLKARIGSRLY